MREINRWLAESVSALAIAFVVEIAERRPEGHDLEQVTQLMRVLRRFTERAHEGLAARRGTEYFQELYRELSETMNQLPVEGLD